MQELFWINILVIMKINSQQLKSLEEKKWGGSAFFFNDPKQLLYPFDELMSPKIELFGCLNKKETQLKESNNSYQSSLGKLSNLNV